MRNSSFISLPLWPKQLVTVCGHVGLPAFGREQGLCQSHVQVQPVSSWKEFPQHLFPQMWQKQRHHWCSRDMGSFEAELTLLSELSSQLFSLLLSLLVVYMVPKCPSPPPFQHGAPCQQPSAPCTLWLQEGREALLWQPEGGMLNNLGSVKAVLFNGKLGSFY